MSLFIGGQFPLDFGYLILNPFNLEWCHGAKLNTPEHIFTKLSNHHNLQVLQVVMIY
jgi:hypothetical protein